MTRQLPPVVSGSVVNVAAADAVERFPAPSLARTTTTYCVAGVNPVNAAELVVDWVSRVSVVPCLR